MKKYFLLSFPLTCLLLSCGGGGEEEADGSGEEGAGSTPTSGLIIENPFKDITGSVREVIHYYSFPTDSIDLTKKISFYVEGTETQLHFNDNVAEIFEINWKQKNDYMDKIFDDISKGTELVEYIEENIAPKDTTTTPETDTLQIIAFAL